MRKKMTKEVTKTTVKVAKMIVGENGLPVAEQLPDEILIGNVSMEKAQKKVSGNYDFPVTVFGVEATTEIYEMDVAEFIKHATLKTEGEDTEENESEDEE